MQKAVVIRKTGGPEVLTVEDIQPPSPTNINPDSLIIRHTAIGVNYIDLCYRSGLYKAPSFPLILGIEAAGVVEHGGSNILMQKGQRVVYGTAPSGAYCQRRAIHGRFVVGIPDVIPDDVAAAVLTKGLTAHFLIFRTFRVKKEHTILVHAAAGGVGSLICQMAKWVGATVIGTVGTPEKAAIAKRHGCDYPIVYSNTDFVKSVMEITKGEGVPVVYDSVGKDTFSKSMQCLRPMGLLVSFGESSGPVPPINILSLAQKNIFVTRPTLSMYKFDPLELALSAVEVFKLVEQGFIVPQIYKKYPLQSVAEAHTDIQSRKTYGSCVLMP